MIVYIHHNFLLTYYSSTLQVLKFVAVIPNLSPEYKFSLPK